MQLFCLYLTQFSLPSKYNLNEKLRLWPKYQGGMNTLHFKIGNDN